MGEIKYKGKTRGGKYVYGSLVYMKEHIVKKWKGNKSVSDQKITHPICQIYVPQGLKRMTGTQQYHEGNPKIWKQDFIIHDVVPETVDRYVLTDGSGEVYINCGLV